MDRNTGIKRRAEDQLTADNQDDNGDEGFITTPQYADEAEMAKRRVVHVKRPAAGSVPPSSGGFFKNVAAPSTSAAPAKEAPKLATAFNFGGTSAAASGSAPGAPKPAFGFGFTAPTGSQPAPGSSTSTAPATERTSPPATGVSFGFASKPGDGSRDDKPNEAKPATGLSFGFPGKQEEKDKAPAEPKQPGFNFGIASAQSTGGNAAPPASGAKPVFGAGAFSFKGAVNSFVEGRKKMMEEQGKSEVAAPADGAVPPPAGETTDAQTTTLVGNSSIVVTGDVLASAPAKLFSFVKEEKRWAERGAGDAKVKRQPHPSSEPSGDVKAPAFAYRLLVRDGYSLNARIEKGCLVLTKEDGDKIIFTVATADGLVTYLLKFTGTSAVANGKKFTEELKKAMRASEENPGTAGEAQEKPADK